MAKLCRQHWKNIGKILEKKLFLVQAHLKLPARHFKETTLCAFISRDQIKLGFSCPKYHFDFKKNISFAVERHLKYFEIKLVNWVKVKIVSYFNIRTGRAVHREIRRGELIVRGAGRMQQKGQVAQLSLRF